MKKILTICGLVAVMIGVALVNFNVGVSADIEPYNPNDYPLEGGVLDIVEDSTISPEREQMLAEKKRLMEAGENSYDVESYSVSEDSETKESPEEADALKMKITQDDQQGSKLKEMVIETIKIMNTKTDNNFSVPLLYSYDKVQFKTAVELYNSNLVNYSQRTRLKEYIGYYAIALRSTDEIYPQVKQILG